MKTDSAFNIPRATTIKKSVDLYGHTTSISLESEFWNALQDIAKENNQSIRSIILKIDEERLKSKTEAPPANLSSRVRVFVLQYYREKM